jgi:wobble nucleotide-excising tRNase
MIECFFYIKTPFYAPDCSQKTQIRCVLKWKDAASSFIDTINEHCYGLIDDVLIESTAEGYIKKC